MKSIIVPNPVEETLVAQLNAVRQSLSGAQANEAVSFDLSRLTFVCPLLLLPLAAYIQRTGSTYINPPPQIKSYLDTVRFPSGVSSVDEFRRHETSTYTPISTLKLADGPRREALEDHFLSMVYKIMQATEGARNAVYYPVLELVTNIYEHSGEGQGYVFGQLYRSKGFLDMCIVDAGRGFAKTYQDTKGITLSDEQALSEVMQGHSTKSDQERGWGVRTSKRVVCEALGGGFVLVSGSAALIARDKEDIVTTLPDFSWQGVIAAYRIPRPQGKVDISPYVEYRR